MKEWLIALGPIIAIGGVYLMIFENRRAEKFRLERQKIEELARLADQICLIPTEVIDGEYGYCKINLDVGTHMRIISKFYLDGKLFDQVNELQGLAIAIGEHQNPAKYSVNLLDESKYWNNSNWFEELSQKRFNMIKGVSDFKQKCLELKTEIDPPKLRTRMKRKIKSIRDE